MLQPAQPEPADLLRKHGLKVTAQRIAVLRAVANSAHRTADDVAEVVRSEIGAISRQAVHDALGVLAGNGLIRPIQPAGSAARFEDRVGDNHHHLITGAAAPPAGTPARNSGCPRSTKPTKKPTTPNPRRSDT